MTGICTAGGRDAIKTLTDYGLRYGGQVLPKEFSAYVFGLCGHHLYTFY